MGTGMKVALVVLGAIILVAVIFGFTMIGTYNSLVTLDQATEAKLEK